MTFKVTSNIDKIIKQLEDEARQIKSKVNDVAEDILTDAVISITADWPVESGDSKR